MKMKDENSMESMNEESDQDCESPQDQANKFVSYGLFR